MNNQTIQDKLTHHLSSLEQDQSNLNLLVEISDLYLELDDIESAQNYLDKATTIDREACLAQQGLLYLNQGQFTQAQNCFSEALKLEDTPALRYNLGITHFINYELEEAWEILSPLLDGDHHPDAELLMARILHRQGSLEEAISLAEHVLEHNAEDTDALGLRSLLYFDLNEEELAAESSARALELNPENYDARLVSIMLRLMTMETTVEEIEELLTINPHDSRLWFALGNTYMSQGDLETAEETLKKAVEIYPEFYDCHIALAWCQLLNDHVTEAHGTYQDAAVLVEELADAWGGLALIHALQQDFEQAELLINKSNEINPSCFLTELARSVYMIHQNPQKAKEDVLHALQSSETPISEKLAVLMEEFSTQETLH